MIQYAQLTMRKAVVLLAGLVIAANAGGCQKIKGIFVRPPPEGITQETYTILLAGYEHSVFVKGTQDDIFRFVSNPANHGLRYLKIGEGESPILEEDKPLGLGESLNVKIGMMGVEVKGKIISVNSGKDRHWLVIDNPYTFMTQRWDFEPVKGGTRLTLRMDYQIPEKGVAGQLGRFVDFTEISRVALSDIDFIIAKIQAHFDPSLDVEELLSFGLRGESYEAMLQAYDSRIWVDSPPEEVESWVLDPDNFSMILKEFSVERDTTTRFQQMPAGEVLYIPASLHLGAIRNSTDLFAVKDKKGRETIYRLYFTLLNNLGMMEFRLGPERGGTLINYFMAHEIPSSITSEAMEVILFTTGVPKLLKKRGLMIKNGVEGVG